MKILTALLILLGLSSPLYADQFALPYGWAGGNGSSGQCLTSTGATTAPTFQTCGGGGSLPSIANNTVLGNTSGSTATPTALTTLPSGVLLSAMALGTTQGNSNKWPAQVFEISFGTTGTPNAAAGPIVKISKTENYASTTVCNSNAVDSQCNAAFVVVSQGLGANVEQTTAIVGAAYSSATAGSTNSISGGVFTGEAQSGAVGTGQGLYVQGRRDVATANAQGMELRVQNNSSTDCTVSVTSVSPCDAAWITAQSDGTNATAVSSALHISKTGTNINGFHEAITLNNGSVTDTALNDQSSSTTVVKAGSGHTNIINSPGFTLSGTGAVATTSTLTVQNGAASGAVFIGADVNATTKSANTRKIGRVVAPTYDNTSNPVAVICFDNDGTDNTGWIGGCNSASETALTRINFVTANALNTATGTTAAFIDKNGNFQPNFAIKIAGTKFTTSGCSVSSTTGGATGGVFTVGANSCDVVVTMNGATGITGANGWTCEAHDRTSKTTLIGGESASTATTATISIPAGAGTTDVISFSCFAY